MKCNKRNPNNPSQICERFGDCGKSRKHVAVKRPKTGKAEIIEFYTEDQNGFQIEESVELPRQGSLF